MSLQAIDNHERQGGCPDSSGWTASFRRPERSCWKCSIFTLPAGYHGKFKGLFQTEGQMYKMRCQIQKNASYRQVHLRIQSYFKRVQRFCHQVSGYFKRACKQISCKSLSGAETGNSGIRNQLPVWKWQVQAKLPGCFLWLIIFQLIFFLIFMSGLSSIIN